MRRAAGTIAAVVVGLGLLPTATGVAAAGQPVQSSQRADDFVSWPPAAPAQLTITTDGGVPVASKDDYVAATVTLDGASHVGEVKGRGNSTWSWAKKPYKLKLEEDAALVGTEAFDEWVLLAGYADRSALRTAAAFAIASRTSLKWTPRYRFVDVVLNGQSQGLYLLTEQVEEGEGRVELPDSGFLLEINKRYLRDDEPGFRTKRGTPVSFKDPDEVDRKQRRTVRRAVSQFEKVLYGPRFADPKRGYAAHVDVKKAIDWYLVEELFRNQDSNFQSSVYVSWKPGGRFRFGPVWDFDLSAGTRWQAQTRPEGWYTRLGRHWFTRMLEDPAFSARVKSRWARLRPVVEEVLAQLPAAASTVSASAEADWRLWHADGTDLPWTVHATNHAGEVEHVRAWLSERARWLSSNEVRFGTVRMKSDERDRTVWVPVQLQSPADRAVTVPYDVVGGTATRGADFELATGSVDFGAGQQVRYVPLQVLDDTAAESAETVLLRLRDVGGQPVVGSPHEVKVTIARNDR